MKRNLLWVSFSCFLVLITLAFQNCNAKKFNATVDSNIEGSLGTMTEDGNTTGEVTVRSCQAEDADCPNTAVIRVYVIVNGQPKLIEPVGEAVEDNPTEDPGHYTFTFRVPVEYKCKVIKVYIVDPTTGVEVQIEVSISLWGGKCSNLEQPTPTNPTGGNPNVSIDDVKTLGRVVQLAGSCQPNVAMTFGGDLLSSVSLSSMCKVGKFKYCGILENHFANNNVTAEITSNGQVGRDNVDVMLNSAPVAIVTIDNVTIDESSKRLTVNGRCNAGGVLDLNFYNTDVGRDVSCPDSGMWSYSDTVLQQAERVFKVTQTTPWGTTSAIRAKFDLNNNGAGSNENLSCAISQTVATGSLCTGQVGQVKGSCQKGLPVFVYVNNKLQTVAFCSDGTGSGGTFSASPVLLEQVNSSNVIKIEQKNAYGRSCTNSKTITTFEP